MNNTQRLIDLFFDLVRIDSISGEEDRIADWIVQFLTDKVTTVQRDSYGNVYAFRDGVGDPIFLAAHMDTVEPGRGITPKIDNGYVVSSGETILGADNKAALAAILFTMENIKEVRPVELIFTRSEEVGNYGAINFDYSLLQSKHGYCFDAAKPLGTIITSSPYYERFDLTILGKEAHASRPHEAHNVLTGLQFILGNVRLGQLDENTIFNMGVVAGGSVRNTIPGRLRIEGEVRSFKEKNLISHKEAFMSNLNAMTSVTSLKYEIEFVRENPGYKFDEPDTLMAIQQVENAFDLMSLPSDRLEYWGVSDANIFNEKDLIAVNLGNGCESPHSFSERVSIESLHQLSRLVELLVAAA